jgi:hypothetical protein
LRADQGKMPSSFSPLPAGERSKPERQRRLRVRGLSTHADSRIGPSPAAHLTMRVDLSPAGRGELSIVAIRLKAIVLRPSWPIHRRQG